MKINIIGLGYIGLPTAVVFADNGADVLGIDKSQSIIDTINRGNVHIEEPGLLKVIKRVVYQKRLRVSTQPEKADVHIIAVPTPNVADEFLGCDIRYVVSAIEGILPVLQTGNVVVVESTIAPRTMEDHIMPIIEAKGFEVGKDIFLAHCPERVLPGQILDELVSNNRIVGGITEACAKKAADVYRLFVKGEIIETYAKTAEMSKLMENTFRDVNIALANELAKVCDKLEINVLDVIKMANKHPRVNLHTPGAGVGGHCLAVDPYFIYAKAPHTANLIKLARDINVSMPEYVVQKVEKLLKFDKTKKIAAFGVTYKPDVDDIRESPALHVIEQLRNLGYKIEIYDPHVVNDDYAGFEEAVDNADLLLCLVGHTQFKKMDYTILKQHMSNPLIYDVTGSLKSDKINIINYGNSYKFIQ